MTVEVSPPSVAPDVPRASAVYTRAEVAKHSSYEDAWVIIDDGVYDVSKFVARHPGGKVILYYRGQDATESFNAFHCDLEKSRKYLKPLQIGSVAPADMKLDARVSGFRKLREDLVEEGFFKPNYFFYIAHLVSIFLMEYLAVQCFSYTGSWLLTATLLATAQQQAGWLQHDFGHASVFRSSNANQWAHYIIIGFMKGASSWWWKSKHTRHHAKTNVVTRDPDMHVEPFFSFSELMAKTRFSKYLPTLHMQDKYWYFIGPPMTTTVLFVYQNMCWMARYAVLEDMAITLLFYIRFEYMFRGTLSGWSLVGMYLLTRFIESHWFTWVTSMSHLPMEIIKDQPLDWLTIQLQGTQNVEGGYFNNWFTGHLNYQIEHHLFPTMPRHHYPEVSKRVRALAEKTGLEYRERGLWQSFEDVMDKLTDVAKAYNAIKDEKKREKQLKAQ